MAGRSFEGVGESVVCSFQLAMWAPPGRAHFGGWSPIPLPGCCDFRRQGGEKGVRGEG